MPRALFAFVVDSALSRAVLAKAFEARLSVSLVACCVPVTSKTGRRLLLGVYVEVVIPSACDLYSICITANMYRD